MRKAIWQISILALVGVAAGVAALSIHNGGADATEFADEAALARARKQVRMLDDLYKTAVVLINDTYVEDNHSASAGEVARELFGAMRSKGWHDARLIDATGKPLNEANQPRGDFEQAAMRKIVKGETYVDAVVEEDGKRFLRAATVVPVVNDRCVMCHPGNKVGDVLGAVSYKLAIE